MLWSAGSELHYSTGSKPYFGSVAQERHSCRFASEIKDSFDCFTPIHLPNNVVTYTFLTCGAAEGMGQHQLPSRGEHEVDAMDAHETDRLRPAGPATALQSFDSEMLNASHIRSKSRSSTPLEELQKCVLQQPRMQAGSSNSTSGSSSGGSSSI